MIILMNMLMNMLMIMLMNMLMIMLMIMYFGHNSTYIGRQPAIFCMRGFLYISYRPVMAPSSGEP